MTKTYNRTLDSSDVKIENAEQPATLGFQVKGVEIDTDKVFRSDALDEEAFMREELDVMLSEPTNENDPPYVEVNVNGDYRLVMRNNEPARLRRYHVAVLAQAKQSRVRQDKIVNPDGSMGFVDKMVTSLTYPFTVIMDQNPKGGPWLRQLLSNPV